MCAGEVKIHIKSQRNFQVCFTRKTEQDNTFNKTNKMAVPFRQRKNTVELFLNKVFFLVPAIWNVGSIYASQIKKLRKRLLVEPVLTSISSVCKAQDPFIHFWWNYLPSGHLLYKSILRRTRSRNAGRVLVELTISLFCVSHVSWTWT